MRIMSEFHHTPELLIDGQPVGSGTKPRNDGTYAALNLREVKIGERVAIVDSAEGVHELVKVSDNGSVLEGWHSSLLGPVVLTLLDGQGFLKRGLVLSGGDRILGSRVDTGPEQEGKPGFSSMKDLGRVGIIAYQPAPSVEASETMVPVAAATR